MAKLTLPEDAVQCHCGINIREEEMVLDENPFQMGESYLLCPQCKLAIWVITSDTSDETQVPLIVMERVSHLKAEFTKFFERMRDNRG